MKMMSKWRKMLTMKNEEMDIIILFVAVAIGTAICARLENTNLNIWIARIIGGLVTVIITCFGEYLMERWRNN